MSIIRGSKNEDAIMESIQEMDWIKNIFYYGLLGSSENTAIGCYQNGVGLKDLKKIIGVEESM